MNQDYSKMVDRSNHHLHNSSGKPSLEPSAGERQSERLGRQMVTFKNTTTPEVIGEDSKDDVRPVHEKRREPLSFEEILKKRLKDNETTKAVYISKAQRLRNAEEARKEERNKARQLEEEVRRRRREFLERAENDRERQRRERAKQREIERRKEEERR